jgi:hypothetical protein
MKLSIMIPTTLDRRPMYNRLLGELSRQVDQLPLPDRDLVEIISQEDSKEISVGLKRQQLLERAQGIRVVGVDSDDWVHPLYVHLIMKQINLHPDVQHIGFFEHCDENGIVSLSRFSIDHPTWADGEFVWPVNGMQYQHERCANPKSVILRDKALQIGYKDMRYGEDRIFAEEVTKILKTEIFIPAALYYYRRQDSDHNERYGIK